MKKLIVLALIIAVGMISRYRIEKIESDNVRTVNNIVRIQGEKGIPKYTVVANKTTDFLLEPIYIENGRSLVSIGRINKFRIGDIIHEQNAYITFISQTIDLDSGMFIIKVSKNITGSFLVEKKYTGYFLPVESVLPDSAKIIAKDSNRLVAIGLNDGDKIEVR